MRKRFELQLQLGQVPIDKVQIPTKSRDELPPVLRGLQWIFQTPEVREQIFRLLEKKVKGDKRDTGRPGMDLWHILVLGVVRLALDCDYDRLSYLAHYDRLLRQIMGLDDSFTGEFGTVFHQKTLSQNVCHVDEALLQEINAIVVKAGWPLFKKKGDERIRAKSDTYVLETDVHFPTDFNLLWDAGRKCILLMQRISNALGQSGWRKYKVWLRQLKSRMRECSQVHRGGGSKKAERLEGAVRKYLGKASAIERRVRVCLEGLRGTVPTVTDQSLVEEVAYFHKMLVKHIDLIERRILRGELIPHEEKVFSLFEPHTEWINKGKLSPAVELGHKLLITTDQNGLVIDYQTMERTSDVEETIPLADRLLQHFGEGQIQSLSVDKGFSAQADRALLELYIPEVIMPKKGRLGEADRILEKHEAFRSLRRKHSAIESDIHCLEKHGLNRCPDKGLDGFKRYVGFGILAYNLHKIGNRLLERERWLLKKAA